MNGADENELQNSDGRIVFVIVHGTGITGESGNCNKDYHDPTSLSFQSFMDYAKTYVQEYNRTQNQKLKVLHLISFLWNGNLLDATSRKPAGVWLGDYLESWNYRNSKIVCIGHSHGCNVINFASHNLRLLRRKSDGLYEGRIKELIFFAPPCKQIIPDEDKSLIINSFGKAFDKCNDIMSITPTNYDQLFVFHSPADRTVNYGSIDALTGIGIVATAGYDVYYVTKTTKKFLKAGIPNTAEEQRDLLLGALIAGGATYGAYKASRKKLKQSHMYNLDEPKNEINLVEGPKVHIETMVDGEHIGHSSPQLLENFATALRILKTQYVLNITHCDDFKINIVTRNEEQRNLLRFIKNTYKTKYISCDEANNNARDNRDSEIEKRRKEDQKNALTTFYKNRKDNCKVQCRISEDENRHKLSISNALNGSDYFGNTLKRLKDIYGDFDSTNFVNRGKLVSDKHQSIYEHYLLESQKDINDVSSAFCNLL